MKKISQLSIGLLLAAGIFSGTAQGATKQCKEISETNCNANNACQWVNGYKRSNGSQVSGYCRTVKTKPQKASSSEKLNKDSRS